MLQQFDRIFYSWNLDLEDTKLFIRRNVPLKLKERWIPKNIDYGNINVPDPDPDPDC
jgi:hypothetical protein